MDMEMTKERWEGMKPIERKKWTIEHGVNKFLPRETNGCCVNYYKLDHDPMLCPGLCRNCIWQND